MIVIAVQPDSDIFPVPEISPVSPAMPPGQAPVIEVTEVIAVLTEARRLDDVTLGVVGQTEPLHQNQLPVRYQVITDISVVGRVDQQQCRGFG